MTIYNYALLQDMVILIKTDKLSVNAISGTFIKGRKWQK